MSMKKLKSSKKKWLVGLFVTLPVFFLLLFAGDDGGSNGGSAEGQNFPAEVLLWKAKVEMECEKNDVPEAVDYILGIIAVETGGNATLHPDIMQCSESQGKAPNSILDPNESIEVGVKYFADAYKKHKGYDLLNVVQGYNYGMGFLNYSDKEYSLEVAIAFSKEKANGEQVSYVNAISTGLGYNYRYNYGNMFYAQMVNQYLVSGSSSVSNSELAKIAQEEIKKGNHAGGQTYWSWYGFNGRVEWCATFVSYCADKANIQMEKFAYCPTGISNFKAKNQWLDGGKEPKEGNIIFFDWEGDGTSDHVGIVESVKDGKVNTIEGNSGDQLARQSYDVGSNLIVGYGTP